MHAPLAVAVMRQTAADFCADGVLGVHGSRARYMTVCRGAFLVQSADVRDCFRVKCTALGVRLANSPAGANLAVHLW